MSDKSVAEIISERRASSCTPDSRSDAYRLGLVIEGGGMRGVVSGAMTAALENLHLTKCFDAVYGASAGAMAAAFFVAGSARAGATIYYEYINNRYFVNPWRIASSKPIMDLDFLVYDVFKNSIPLDCREIIASSCSLNVVMTDVPAGKKAVFNQFETEDELLLALKASASNPLFAGPPVEIDGVGYWDAILTESIPVQSAIDDGCTHVVVLRSRPKKETRSEIGFFERFLARRIIQPESKLAYDTYCGKVAAYRAELDLIESLGQKCLTIAPTDGRKLSQSSTNRAALMSAAVDGYRNTLVEFDEDESFVGPMIGHFRRR